MALLFSEPSKGWCTRSSENELLEYLAIV